MITFKQITGNVPVELLNSVSDNKYFLDLDSPYIGHELELLQAYVDSPCCQMFSIELDNNPVGFVIFENIRKCGLDFVATVHPCLSRIIWGNNAVTILNDLRSSTPFTVLHCEVPDIALHTCGLALKLGFKKVGTKSKCLPYKNSKDEMLLRDVYIYEWSKNNVE